MSYHLELFENLSEGIEPGKSHCGDQKDNGVFIGVAAQRTRTRRDSK